VLGAVGWYPLCLEDIVERSGLPVAAVVIALEALEEEGMVTAEAGWWCRRQG
jgi:predicted Rossmann fold nucleotide-binding protein DprA/Smf involved in DNA uptake